MLLLLTVLSLAAAPLCGAAQFDGTISDHRLYRNGVTKELLESLDWVKMASDMADISAFPAAPAMAVHGRVFGAANTTSSRLGTNPVVPLGTYVSECLNLTSNFGNGRIVKMSIARTFRYEKGFTWHGDVTQYFHDDVCNPSLGDPIMKLVLDGEFEMRGDNNLPGMRRNTQRTNYKVTKGTYTFGSVPGIQSLIAFLNKDCPCGRPWSAGQNRTVVASTCKPVSANDRFIPDLCKTVGGLFFYHNLLFITPATFAVSEGDWDSTIGWQKQINTSYQFTELVLSGDQNPKDCDYVLYHQCQVPVEDAVKTCDTCYDLECDGCIYRTIESHDLNGRDWNDCCPCLHFQADKTPSVDDDFIKINC